MQPPKTILGVSSDTAAKFVDVTAAQWRGSVHRRDDGRGSHLDAISEEPSCLLFHPKTVCNEMS